MAFAVQAVKRASPRHHAAVVASLVLLGTTASVHVAHADELVPVHVDYAGRPGCPDAGAFVREVLARAPRARIASPAEPARTLVARIRAGGAHGFDGVLVVREAGVASTERDVHAQSCAELVTALAIIAAVVIDPVTAKTGAVEPSAEPEAAPDDASVPAPPEAAAPPAAEATAPVPSITPAASPRDTGRPDDAWRLSAGAGGGIVAGTAPSVLLSVPAFFEVARELSGVVEPALRLRVERTATASSSREGGAFVRTGGAADLCPIAFHGRSLRAQPCGRTELAGLYARGHGVEPVRSQVRPWFAFGPVARVRLDLVGPVFVELEGALLVSVVRDRFYVESATLVYRPPALGATTALAVGVAF